MVKFILNNKFALSLAFITFGFYLWASFGSFKLFKSEYGTSYKVGQHNGSIHHK